MVALAKLIFICSVLLFKAPTGLPALLIRLSFFSNAIGVGWIMSDERFMSNVKFIDFLKLRAEIGSVGYEAYTSPYYYNTALTSNTGGGKFGPVNTGYWFGSTTDATGYQTFPSRTGNPDFTWETRREKSIGVEALLFKHKLSLEVNYYNNLRDGQIIQLSLQFYLT